MAEIEWLKIPGRKAETWNPIRGCSPVSRKCDHCWARSMAWRGMQPGDDQIRDWKGVVKTFPDRLAVPFGWREPRAVAVGLMSDIGHEGIDDTFRAAIHGVAVLNPAHLFIFVTARPGNLGRFRREYDPNVCAGWAGLHMEAVGIDTDRLIKDRPVPETWADVPNVWDLVSVEDQAATDARIPELLAMPSALRGLSVEPMLGPIDLRRFLGRFTNSLAHIGWIVIGGESGPNARPFDVEAAHDMVDTCRQVGTATFVKQLGAFARVENLNAMDWPRGTIVRCHGDVSSGNVALQHPKGADPSEWPRELRVREWPQA